MTHETFMNGEMTGFWVDAVGWFGTCLFRPMKASNMCNAEPTFLS